MFLDSVLSKKCASEAALIKIISDYEAGPRSAIGRAQG